MDGIRWAFRCGSWVPTRSEWTLAARCIQPEEKERIGRFVFAKDAKLAMAGRLLMRKLVCEKMGYKWDGFRLERTARGKPFLPLVPHPDPPRSPWSFNVSHQGDYAVLAAEPGRPVGVDVMKTSRPGSKSVQEFFRIMKRQFTDLEWRSIRTAGSEWEQLHTFYRHWALKESFIKAIGSGLGFDLQRVEFHISPNQMREGEVHCETRMYLDEEEEERWTFEELLLDPEHHVAVALGEAEVSKSQGDDGSFAEAACRTFTCLSASDLLSGVVPLSQEDPAFWESFCKKTEAPMRQKQLQ